ncbi:acyltransferase-domain-containing protein [Pisolithus croceorrhizus]|nr:acyltransferase-domain-containing protein [Pisolithus croceorrhizus]KAI6128474.1 acyltransferase-domain-containing protein [Pisolithus croceorrhizus]
MSQLLSTAVITATGLTCKAFLHSGLCSITISNLAVLLDALQDQSRRKGQGLITVSNHLSTLDDPITWGILPSRCYTKSRTIRWVLGASDIMFTNPVFSAFFRNGQVIETFRGEGIFQPALDAAIDKLNQGHWVHLFGEGKVCQPPRYPQVNGVAHLQRFKWGVGRVVMEANVLPLIIPMWLTGFDRLMPEGRPFPFKFFPKVGVKLGVAFGDPIPAARIAALLDSLPNHRGEKFLASDMAIIEEREMDHIRSEVTAIVQRAVEDLGWKLSGNQLDKPLA